MMPDAVFPFPGGKSKLASWILEHVPEHTCFVEVFGGAAGVLVNKDPDTSDVEVYNDRDGDLVHFFETMRDHSDELVDWLEDVPFSRELFERWSDLYFNGYRSPNDVERAGQFFYLRYTQWGAVYSKKAGFATSKVRSRAQSFKNKVRALGQFSDRFDSVLIEHLDWRDLFEKYDAAETVFYCDPPYVGKEDYYRVGGMDHSALVGRLRELKGTFLCSYEDLPEGMDEFHVIGRDEKFYLNSGKRGSAKRAREHLVTNRKPVAGGCE